MGEWGVRTVVVLGEVAQAECSALESASFSVLPFRSVDDAGEGLYRHHVLVLIGADPDIDTTLATLRRVVDRHGAVPVVIGSDTNPKRIVEALHAGAFDYVVREGSYLADLPARLDAAAERARARAESNLVAFIGRLQHDVKNPINNIIGYVDLLLELPGPPLSEEQQGFLKRVRVNSTNVIALLERFAHEAARLGT